VIPGSFQTENAAAFVACRILGKPRGRCENQERNDSYEKLFHGFFLRQKRHVFIQVIFRIEQSGAFETKTCEEFREVHSRTARKWRNEI